MQDWQRWIARNRDEAKRLFPSKQFIRWDEPSFSYMIVIGKRENLRGNNAKRKYLSESLRINIRTFDYLTDDLLSRRFSPFAWISRDFVPVISEQENNDFANPFHIANSDPEWRSIAREGEYNSSHMIAVNLGLIMKNRRYNSTAQADFEAYLAGLAAEDKAIRKHEYQILGFT